MDGRSCKEVSLPPVTFCIPYLTTTGEFLHAVVTYCLFEQDEMLRFCFYIFDKDKNG